MSAKMIRIAIKEPGSKWKTQILPNDPKTFQVLVGGYIETVPGAFSNTVFVVNEEGKLRGFPENFTWNGDMLLGTVLAVGVVGDEFCGFPYPAFQLGEATDVEDGKA